MVINLLIPLTYIYIYIYAHRRWGSVVGIATGYGLYD
jgi:hypothetical protein